MSHSHRRKTSQNLWFRMDVPKDVRDLAGVTSWQISLGTSDLKVADVRRASYSAHYKSEVLRLRAINARSVQQDAAVLVGRAFERLAAHFRSMDVAIASELTKIAIIVRSSWGNEHARAAEQHHLGLVETSIWAEEPAPIATIDDERERKLFQLRAEVFEGKDNGTDGLVYQELASTLLARGQFEPLRIAVGYLPYLEPEIDISTPARYVAIAEQYLTRLAGHNFSSWPDGIREALLPIAAPARSIRTVEHTVINAPPALDTKRTLRDAFEEWKRRKGFVGKHKTVDEFETAVNRFEMLCDTVELATITTEMVETFGELVAKLPARPRKAISALPLTEQINRAAADQLPTLMPPTVGKQIAALKAILGVAKKKRWIRHNPADGVTIDGASWQGDERDHFSDDDMQLIYTAPLMTDPTACSDTMFWILFLAPFHGSRPGEHCKLRPGDIVQEDGAWVMRIRRDRRTHITADGSVSVLRRQKTRSSIRDVPLHWVLLEAGFIEFVERQRARGAEWLFDDLKIDGYGDRYKLLSAEINRALRKIGIVAIDKAFYSTRHTMKREGRRRRIAKSSLDQLAGHVSSDAAEKYGQGLPIETLKEDIDRLEFRSVPWDPVVVCGKARFTRSAAV